MNERESQVWVLRRPVYSWTSTGQTYGGHWELVSAEMRDGWEMGTTYTRDPDLRGSVGDVLSEEFLGSVLRAAQGSKPSPIATQRAPFVFTCFRPGASPWPLWSLVLRELSGDMPWGNPSGV